MKQFLRISFLALLFLLPGKESFGEMGSSKMGGSSIQTSPGMKPMEPLEKPHQASSPSSSQSRPTVVPPLLKSTPQVVQHAEYLHPGILVYLNGKWEGSDHLLNVSKNIGVYVTIIKPEEEVLGISQETLQKEIEKIFSQANIKPQTIAPQGRPALPAFEIEIFIYPIEKGYAAFCDGRLFESVTLDRFNMDPNMAFQAITWEKKALIVGPKSSFADQLSKTVQSIAASFTERFQAYERIKSGELR